MGVPGLLKALGDVQREIHVVEYRGLCVGIDAYCWLHKGKYLCPEELLNGKPTDAYLRPIMDVVAVLRQHGVEPFLVFDGGPLPAKRAVEVAREQAREDARWKAASLIRTQRSANAQGPPSSLLSGAIDITPEMAAACMRRAEAENVPFVVAPYEADAQLAQLSLSGRIHVAASEDADLLAFGCPRVVFGLDSTGRGKEICLADAPRSRGLLPYRMTPAALPDLCVLSGCDYLQAIPRVALKTAASLLHRSAGDVDRALVLARREGLAVPRDYGRRVREARLVFLSQTVYDLVAGQCRPLRPFPDNFAEQFDEAAVLELLGRQLPSQTARGVAEGRLHPCTLQPLMPHPVPAVSPTVSKPVTNQLPQVAQRSPPAPAVPTPSAREGQSPASRMSDHLVGQRQCSAPHASMSVGGGASLSTAVKGAVSPDRTSALAPGDVAVARAVGGGDPGGAPLAVVGGGVANSVSGGGMSSSVPSETVTVWASQAALKPFRAPRPAEATADDEQHCDAAAAKTQAANEQRKRPRLGLRSTLYAVGA